MANIEDNTEPPAIASEGSESGYEVMDGVLLSYYEKRAAEDYRDGVGTDERTPPNSTVYDEESQKRIVLAIWPNGSINQIFLTDYTIYTDTFLFGELDQWGDPCDALIVIVGSTNFDDVTVGLQLMQSENGKPLITVDADGHWIRRFRFNGNIATRWLRSLQNAWRRDHEKEVSADSISEYAPDAGKFPEPPGPEFSFEQVKNMEPFSGVYFAYVGRVCVYVGEGKDVTERCRKTKARQREFKDVTGIGVLKVEPEQRLRMEKFYIGLLNPCRNLEIQRGRGEDAKEEIVQPETIVALPYGSDDGQTSIGDFEAEGLHYDLQYTAPEGETEEQYEKRHRETVAKLQAIANKPTQPIQPDRFGRLLTYEEAGEQMSVSAGTIRKLVKDGELTAVKSGRKKLINSNDLNAFVESRTVTPANEHQDD